MKLVIQTQIRENYAAHSGFTGEYRWKMKGGNTYVVRDLSSNNINRYNEMGIPKLKKLIESKDEAFDEYILSHALMEDDDVCCEKWETPVELVWGGDRWLASRTVENGEYGYMAEGVIAKREEWIPLEGGERGHYKCEYQTVNGWFDAEETAMQLKAA